jgi:hypothetical protein
MRQGRIVIYLGLNFNTHFTGAMLPAPPKTTPENTPVLPALIFP